MSLGSSDLPLQKIVIPYSDTGNGPLFHTIAGQCIAIVNSYFSPELLRLKSNHLELGLGLNSSAAKVDNISTKDQLCI